MLVAMVILPSEIDVASHWSHQDPGADTTRCTHVHHTPFLAVIRGCGLRDHSTPWDLVHSGILE